MYRHITQADSNFYDFHVSLVDNKDTTLFCDTETTGLDSRINKLLSLQIYNGSDIFIYDFTKLSNEHLLNIIKLIKNNNIKTVWHNAKFDIKFIYNATGIWLTNIADTMQLEVLINAGRGKSFYSLDELSNKYCNVQLNKAQRDSFLTDNVTELTDQMLNYSAMDVKVLKDIYTKQLEKVVELNEEQVMNLEMGIIWLVANMEYNGVLLDTEKWTVLEKQERIRLDDVTSSIKNYISENVNFGKFTSALDAATTFNIPVKTKKLQRELETYISADVIKGWVKENINLASPKQLLTILNLLGIKVDSTDKKVLKKLEKSEFLDLLLEKSECAKRISTYGLSVLEFIHPVSGRIHTDFINMGAATGRFSSGNPLNLQNIPRAEGYHESFIASPGFDFISCDYCLPGSTKVLKSNLEWVNISELKEGDGLVSIEEYPTKKFCRREMKEGFVEKVGKTNLPCLEIEMENGDKLISSTEHPWLVQRNGTHNYQWVKTSDLKEGDALSLFVKPWNIENHNKFDLGYLSGIFDGEGSCNISRRGSFVSFYQKKGKVLDKVMNLLKYNGFRFTGPYERKSGFSNRTTESLFITGIDNIVRFFGLVNPIRLSDKQKQYWLDRSPDKCGEKVKVTSIKSVGNLDLISMQTSTHTFLADGYWTHNSQQEFRLAGAISNEKLIIDAYVKGADMHTATASLIYNKPLNDITKEERFVGKSQPLDSKVLTPSGWSTMGNISEGDFVIGYDGKPKKVLKTFPQGMRPIYKIKFSDGSSAECDEDHLWSVKRTSNKGKFKTLSTKQIIDYGIHKFKKDGTKERKFAIPTVKPIDYKEVQNFVLHPYVLGVILGDGNISGNQARISSGDDYIINKFSSLLPNGCSLVYRGKYDYYIYGGNKLGRGNHNPVLKALKDLSLFGTNSETKFIPSIYKYSSVEQRLDLLRGLIDTDGYVNKKGSIIYNSVSEHLINDVIDVVRSLGGFCYKRFKNNNKKGCYEISINIKDVNIVSLPRKLNRVKTQKKWLYRRIDSIEYVSHKEAKCILVDSPDHLYITDDYIVTHNTANFTIIYGGTEYALMKNLGISVEKSRDIIKRFNEGFKTFSAFKENAENKILSMGYSTTLMGRRRHNEERPLFMDSMELLRYESKVKREGFNHIIQGSAADITKLAMLNICNKNPFGDKLRMLIQVHDELDLESHKSITNDAVEFIKQEMLAAEQKFLGDIPAAMDCSVSDCWKH